jgi:hypothetical protein
MGGGFEGGWRAAQRALRGLMEFLIRATVAALGMSVGLVGAYEALLILQASPYTIYTVMGIAVCGSVLMVMAHEAWHNRAYVRMTLMAVVGLICSTYAMTSSIGGDATIKDLARGVRLTKQANAELDQNRRQNVLTRIAELEAMRFEDRTTLAGATSEILQPQVDALKGCKCPQLKIAKQKLAAAKELAKLRLNRDGWSPTVEEATGSIDPQIETMTTVAKDLGTDIPAQSMRAGLSVWRVIAMELAGIFIPIGAFGWGRNRPSRKSPADIAPTLRPETSPEALPETLKRSGANPPALPAPETLLEALNPPEPLEIKAPETLAAQPSEPSGSLRNPSEDPPAPALLETLPETRPETLRKPPVKPSGRPPEPTLRPGEAELRQWASEAMTGQPGHNLQAKPLYEVYVVWCEKRGIAPLTLALFGKYLPDAGYPKEKDKKTGLMVYTNVALKQVPLKVVK